MVTWQLDYHPTPRQRELHGCRAHDALLIAPVEAGREAVHATAITTCLAASDVEVLLLRASYRQLETETVPVLRGLLPDGVARYTDHAFRFPASGSVLRVGWLRSAEDLHRYINTRPQMVLFDQVEQFSHRQFLGMRAGLVWSAGLHPRGWDTRTVSTTPRPVSGWLRETFVDPSPGRGAVFIADHRSVAFIGETARP